MPLQPGRPGPPTADCLAEHRSQLTRSLKEQHPKDVEVASKRRVRLSKRTAEEADDPLLSDEDSGATGELVLGDMKAALPW